MVHVFPLTNWTNWTVGWKSSTAHPKASQWRYSLDSVWKWCLVLSQLLFSQFKPSESWHCHLGMCPFHWTRKKPDYSARSGSRCPHVWADNVAEPRPETLKQPQIITLLPQACRAGTGMMTMMVAASLLSTSLQGTVCSSPRNRVNLDSWHHMTLTMASPIFSVQPGSHTVCISLRVKLFKRKRVTFGETDWLGMETDFILMLINIKSYEKRCKQGSVSFA